MSQPPLPVKKSLGSCSNPSCAFFFQICHKAPKKCSKCKSAQYCDRVCQTAHWKEHKEFCAVWAQSTSENPGGITIQKIKLKMAHLIWLVRGLTDYTDYLWKEYDFFISHDDERRRGFMEFHFTRWEQLFAAIDFIESLPVVEQRQFRAFPGSPSYMYDGFDAETRRAFILEGKEPEAQMIDIRKVPPNRKLDLVKKVDQYMHPSTNETRKSLQTSLDIALPYKDVFVISVSVDLTGDYTTNLYDLYYRGLSWAPE